MIHVLLIEDSKGDILLTKRTFKKSFLDVEMGVARDDREALAYLKSGNRPDVVLLDLNIPGKSGFEILTAIKAEKSLASIPVIMLSSSEAEHDIQAAYAHYASGYMIKPLDETKFVAILEDLGILEKIDAHG